MKILSVAGARPNFMKIAPIQEALDATPAMEGVIVHTGQHYDDAMSRVFFDELGIPTPKINLEVGSGERLEQIRRIAHRFRPVVAEERPDAVLVVGDVNSTIACARVARERGIPVVHVEAGLRSFDMEMPEEINRLETDRISDLLFVTEPSGMENLARERVPGQAFHVGNVMIDTLVKNLSKARSRAVWRRLGLQPGGFFVGTFHRPSNVDSAERVTNVVGIIEHAAESFPLVLPLHPRTRASLQRYGLLERLRENDRVHLLDPLGYLDFVSLIQAARGVITDSGGLQEETTYLGVPCITMRDNTERPVTVEVGTNVLAGTDPQKVRRAISEVACGRAPAAAVPELWDGRAADRIVRIMGEHLA